MGAYTAFSWWAGDERPRSLGRGTTSSLGLMSSYRRALAWLSVDDCLFCVRTYVLGWLGDGSCSEFAWTDTPRGFRVMSVKAAVFSSAGINFNRRVGGFLVAAQVQCIWNLTIFPLQDNETGLPGRI